MISLQQADKARPGTSRRLRDEIENAILTGALRPGERLDEVSLAQRFGVSRTPVREALAQLSSAGLVELRPRRSALVSQVSPERLVEMFEVMAGLEGMAARLAARRHTTADLASLMRAHEACRKAAESDDADEYYYENEAFHQSIYVASGNHFLAEHCLALHRRLKPFRRLQLRVRNRIVASLAEHEAVVTAIRSHDAEKADSAIQSHIRIQGERFGDLIASLRKDPTAESLAAAASGRGEG